MRPFVARAVAHAPRDDDGDATVPLLDAINSQMMVALPVAPLDR
jgi:hypothetical protein